MTSVDLFDLYLRASQSVFRLEALQEYSVPSESEQIRKFREGNPVAHAKGVARSMETIQTLVEAGIRLYRVHVIDLPLSAYLRYEMAAYAENISAGEDVAIAVRAWHHDLAGLTEDFALFDGDAAQPSVVWMRYTPEGRIASLDYSENPVDVARACHYRDTAVRHAIPLGDFTATQVDPAGQVQEDVTDPIKEVS